MAAVHTLMSALGKSRCKASAHLAVAAATLSQIPGIRSVLAQEYLLWQMAPFIDAPDFLEGEDSLLRQWKEAVPEAEANARDALAEELGDQLDWPGRTEIRMAAHRRAYCSFFGSETLARLYELGGEALVPVKLDSNATLRIGVVLAATYKHDSRRWPEYLEWRKAEPVVEKIEAMLCPEVAVPTREKWCRAREIRDQVRPFKEWNRCSHLPSLLTTQVFDAAKPPEGISLRPGIMEALTAGAGTAVIDVLHAMGISAFVTEPAKAFLLTRAAKIEELAQSDDILMPV